LTAALKLRCDMQSILGEHQYISMLWSLHSSYWTLGALTSFILIGVLWFRSYPWHHCQTFCWLGVYRPRDKKSTRGFGPELATTHTDRYQDRWKWFLPASRSSINPREPHDKRPKTFVLDVVLDPCFYVTHQEKQNIYSLPIPSRGPIRGELFYRLPYVWDIFGGCPGHNVTTSYQHSLQNLEGPLQAFFEAVLFIYHQASAASSPGPLFHPGWPQTGLIGNSRFNKKT